MKKQKLNIDQFQIVEKYPVHWGNMDAARHVNNLVYLRWTESSRIRFFEETHIDANFSSNTIGPILGWQDCKYIRPMTYPDTAIVGTRTHEILEDRFVLESIVFSSKLNQVAAISKQTIVPYDYKNLCKAALPNAWVKEIQKYL